MVYLLYASAPKNNNLYFYGFSPASVLPTRPAVENYLYVIFPEDIQGRMEASEINLKKKMVPTSKIKGIDLSIF